MFCKKYYLAICHTKQQTMKTLIVEDEVDARKILKFLLKQYFPDIDIIGEAASVSKAKNIILKEKPELVFLDVRLEDGTGFDLLESLDKIDFQIIFTTAYDNYAIKAIKFAATDYLLKPINPVEFKTAVEKALTKMQLFADYIKNDQNTKDDQTISVKTAQHTYFVSIRDIIRLEADGSYTSIITKDGKILASKNLKFYEKILPEEVFIRTHQSHLVNKKCIKSIDKDGKLKLTNNDLVPISFRKKSVVRNFLKKQN